MQFPKPLIPGTLVRRYKRFLADVTLESGETITAHCANPGAMTGLADPGIPVWLSLSDDPKRKLKYSLEVVQVDDGAGPCCVGINTSHPNRRSVARGAITQPRKSRFTPEVKDLTEEKTGFSLCLCVLCGERTFDPGVLSRRQRRSYGEDFACRVLRIACNHQQSIKCSR